MPKQSDEQRIQTLKEVLQFVEVRKAAGWTKLDFAAALDEMLNSPDGTTPIADAKFRERQENDRSNDGKENSSGQ